MKSYSILQYNASNTLAKLIAPAVSNRKSAREKFV